MTASGGCNVSLVRYHLGNDVIPSGTKKVPGNYQTGVPDRYELLWAVIDPSGHLTSDFNLKDIDPDSIKVGEVFSIEIIANRGDPTDPHLPPKDRSMVTFTTSNLLKSIHKRDFVDGDTIKKARDESGHESGTGDIGFLLEPGTSNRLAKDEQGDILQFHRNDLAVRFGKAFKHAVELCGGKPSAF